MKALRFVFASGNTVMGYLSKPNDDKYGIAFAGTKCGDYPNIVPTDNFEKSMKEWADINSDDDEIESIEFI